MHAFSWLGLGLGSFACFGGLPTVFTILACIDIYRRREPWWWYPIVFFFPWFGTIAYFVMTRAPWRFATDLTVSRDRRRRADARLRALDTQLAHWRGPAVLAEAGEELLVLGRHAEARERFVEARKAGAAADDVNLGLAETLVALHAHAEAIPVLEELLLAQPDAGLGRARILLARCFEALNRNADAEASWRVVLERRNEPEAQARLARLLLMRGATDEASRLAHEVIADAKLVGAGLRRRRRPWVDLSRQVVKGRAAKVPGQAQRGAMRRWAWVVAAGVLLMILGIIAIALLVLLPVYRELTSAARQAEIEDSTLSRITALDVMYPWTRGSDPALVALEPDDVDAWLQARLEWDRLHAETLPAAHIDGEADSFGGAMSRVQDMRRVEHADAQSLAEALDHARMGPESFAQLVGIIEGRFLQRADAVGYVLPPSHRSPWVDAWRRSAVPAAVGAPSSAPAADELQGYARLVAGQAGIDDRTRGLLESRRDELERVNPASVPAALAVIVRAQRVARFTDATSGGGGD